MLPEVCVFTNFFYSLLLVMWPKFVRPGLRRGVDLFRTKGVLAVQGMKEKFVFQADFCVMFGICKPCRVQSLQSESVSRLFTWPSTVHRRRNGNQMKSSGSNGSLWSPYHYKWTVSWTPPSIQALLGPPGIFDLLTWKDCVPHISDLPV